MLSLIQEIEDQKHEKQTGKGQEPAKSSLSSKGEQNAIEGLCKIFHKFVQVRRVERGQCPVRRPVFLRKHGIMHGQLSFLKTIPAELQQGMFAHPGQSHPVYVRYSSDLSDGRPDWESTIGIGIKLFNVPGKKFVSDDGADTADFLLQNVPNFFVDTAEDMYNFTKASIEGWGDEWIQRNAPNTNALLDAMQQPFHSVFDTPLWSVVPFKLGESDYCKYKILPRTSTSAGGVDINDPNFLGKELAGRMNAGPATLELLIQRRPTVCSSDLGQAYIDEHFPLDRATVIWDETIAPFVPVATITLPQQDIESDNKKTQEQQIYGNWLAFNIGRVPLVNQPVGSVADARVSVYKTSADYRRKTNSQPFKEPSKPGKPLIKNPSCPFPHHPKPDEAPTALTEEQIARIIEVRVHPGIGIARVGNSGRGFYIGPEVTHPTRMAFGGSRDDTGALKRQAARFRIYGYDRNGEVVAEVQQSSNSSVEWTVHVANKKAAWYEFNAAMDIPATVTMTVPLRNPSVGGGGRQALVIDAGPTTIMGLSSADSTYTMSGEFQGTPVMLGELQTDSVGRLIVLPGHGVSDSPDNQPVFDPNKPSSFNNAAGWYDDIADGPVTARVTINGRNFTADPAWVVSAPPNYAPDIVGWRTLDDLLQSVYMQSGMLSVPQRISFNTHVRPILQRLNELQWVNKGFLAMFGAGGPMNFSDHDLLTRLSSVPATRTLPDPYAELRRTIYNSFRPTQTRTVERRAWPWQYGDAFGYTDPDPTQPPSPDTYLKLPPFYDYVLSNWVSGDFINDYEPKEARVSSLNDIDLQKQPEMLDRAAMHYCLADAFHPGAELTWPMRHASMYRAPYRIRMREAGKADPSYGRNLTNANVVAINGPLYEQGPGDLSRWMAIPWQGDTAYCRSGYDMEYDPYLPTFWPARVPNQVLTQRDYETLCDQSKPSDVRIAAFYNRVSWLRQLKGSPPQQMEYMIQHFGDLGVIEAKKRPSDIDWLPEWVYVENLNAITEAEIEAAYTQFMAENAHTSAANQLALQAGWASAEERDEFAMIKRRGN